MAISTALRPGRARPFVGVAIALGWVACDKPPARPPAVAAVGAIDAGAKPAAPTKASPTAPASFAITWESDDVTNARRFPAVAGAMVGLLEARPAAAAALAVHELPSSSSPRVATLDNAGIRGASATCKWFSWWVANADYDHRPRCADVVEISEEQEGVPVFEVTSKAGAVWYRIIAGADGSFGWVTGPSPYHSLEQLVTDKNKMTYLTGHWDNKLYAKPGGKRPRGLRGDYSEPVYKARGTATVDGQLWLHVDVTTSLCTEGKVKALGSGWVRAVDDKGRLQTWLFSRGC